MRGHRTLLVTFCASALLLGAFIDPVHAASEVRATKVETRLSGYSITATGTASGGWLGSYRLGGKTVYRIDPYATGAARGYTTPRRVAKINGSTDSRVTKRDVARAAWVLSKYGPARVPGEGLIPSQAAAVDIVTYALLAKGRHRWKGPSSDARISQSGNEAGVRRLARYMFNKSRKLAGPYRVHVRPSRAAVSERIDIGVRVLSASGEGVRNYRAGSLMPVRPPAARRPTAGAAPKSRSRPAPPGWCRSASGWASCRWPG